MSGNKEEKTEEIQSEPVSDISSSSQEAEVSASSSSSGTEEDTNDQKKIDETQNRIQGLEEEIKVLKDQYLRKQAEFENYRKRMQKEKQETVQFSNKQLLQDLVPIIDDFERAIKSSEDSKDFNAFHDGILLIEKRFSGLLERKWGLLRFDSVGEVFDPTRHEAITTENREDHEQSMVLEDYQKGYLLHDRVLRAAKVKVSIPVSDEEKEKELSASKEKESSGS